MIRNLWLIALLGILAMAAGWMAEHPGQVTLQWFGYEVETSAAFLAVALVIAAFALWIGFRILAMLLFMPSHLGKARGAAAQQRGLTALTDAFIALGDQDAQTASKHLKIAEKYLPDPTLPHLLGLQIARQQGDEAALRQQFQALQDSAQTRPLALRGLVEEARRNQRLEDALTGTQLKELLTLRPRHKPTLLLAIDIYSGQRRWQEALQWVIHGQKKWVFSRSEARHLTAVIYTEQGQAMLAEKNTHSATEMFRAALKRDASLTAAAIALGRILIDTADFSQAASMLRKAWAAQPHPELATLYNQCFPALTPQKRLLKIQSLVKSSAGTWEALMAEGQSALEAGNFTVAREKLKAALGSRETVSLCKAMAELEQKENKDSSKASYWLGQAVAAQADAVWRCSNCGQQTQEWSSHCPECSHFDRIAWQTPQYAVFAAAATS